MSYDYTDGHGYTLKVHPLLPGPAMEIATPKGTVSVGPDEAPALALAILEAAGIDPDDVKTGTEYTREATYHLQKHRCELAEAQEREAEDAKVREFVNAIPGVSYLDESEDHWRHLYLAAREFFARDEKPAPRVLNYGDPEPESGTWRSNNDVLYQKDPGGWFTVNGCYSVLWSHFNAGAFPMTEVTS